MARGIDYERARSMLAAEFANAEASFADGLLPPLAEDIERATERLMTSPTQAYREVLLGCCLARMLDQSVDIRLP
jgi:hypothetical protein